MPRAPRPRPTGPPHPAGIWPALVASFVGGFAVMGAEMAFARQMAPWFGSSLPVWATLISVLLLALALGAALGGRLSLGASRRLPARLLLLAGVGLLAAAWLLPALFASAARARELGVAVAVLAGLGALLVAAGPLVLLGALTPALVAASVGPGAPAGLVAGRLGAAATGGSLAGTLGTAFLALPALGTHATALLLAALCAGTGLAAGGAMAEKASGAPGPPGTTTVVATLALLGLFAGAALLGRPFAPAPPRGTGVVLEARETPYQAAFVVEDARGTRSLRLNSLREWHSHHQPGGPVTEGVWPYFLLGQALRPGCAQPPREILVLGLGAGTLARDLSFAYPDSRVDGVEIDAEVVELGRRWFELPATTAVTIADGRRFLNRPVGKRYDLILIDAFSGAYLPFQLATRESFARAALHLAPGGAVGVNVLSFAGNDGLARALGRTMGAVFDEVQVVPVERGYNALLFAWQGTASAAGCAEPMHPAQRDFVRNKRGRARPLPADGAPLLTDDHAPVEWLTHRMAYNALFGRRDRERRP